MSGTKNHTHSEKTSFDKTFVFLGCEVASRSGDEVTVSECPFCGKESKFSFNAATGEYQCKAASCEAADGGNATTFLRLTFERLLEGTTNKDYHVLRDRRSLSLQTLKRAEVAYLPEQECWLIPFKNPSGKVVSAHCYWPERKENNKRVLAGFTQCLYRLETLTDDAKPIFVCEGPWDAIALDQHFHANKSSKRYHILAVPSASIFKKEWAKFFEGRDVRLLFDHDEAGRRGQEHVAKVIREAGVRCKKIAGLDWPAETEVE